MRGALIGLAAAIAVAGCRHAAPPTPPDPWQRLTVPGAPGGVYEYPDPIVRYAPDDRGAYVVHVAPDDGGDARRTLLTELGATDDILGDDGYVVRMAAAARDAIAARDGVSEVAILQPVERRSVVLDRTSELPEARIDLFADATADETATIAAWVTWRGGRVLWKGRTALRVRLPLEAISEASRLGLVRWIE